jgi:predicted  nucleic acid-binding Zn-ribbon protein
MPSKCVKCGKLHPDDADYIMKSGCDKCGSKFFFFVREGAVEQAEREIGELSRNEINEMERDIRDILPEQVDDGETVVLDVEAIRVVRPGKYRIDVVNLFNQRPIVVRIGPGKYELDLSTMVSRIKGRKGKPGLKD